MLRVTLMICMEASVMVDVVIVLQDTLCTHETMKDNCTVNYYINLYGVNISVL